MRRRHLFRTLIGISAFTAKSVFAAGHKPAKAKPPETPAQPDDEISRVCELIAHHLDREKADDRVYEVLITILRTETRPFPVPSWLADDEIWQHVLKVEAAQLKKRAGLGSI